MSTEPLPIIVARIETKLDLWMKNQEAIHGDQEVRLRSLEKTRDQARGGYAAMIFVSGLFGGAVGPILDFFKHK